MPHPEPVPEHQPPHLPSTMTDGERALGEVARAMAAFAAAVVPAFTELMRQVAIATERLRPLLEYFEQHREEFEALRSAPPAESCHCLCKATHSGVEGICEGYTGARLKLAVGAVDVPMCGPCFAAAIGASAA